MFEYFKKSLIIAFGLSCIIYFINWVYEEVNKPTVKICSKITESQHNIILQCKDQDNG